MKHVAISVSHEASDDAMRKGPDYVLGPWLRRIWRELEESGFYAGALIVHHVRSEQKTGGAKRYHIGKNYVSLHVHAVGYGFLESAPAFKARTGLLYVNKGARRDLAGTVSYLLDHALVVDGKHAIRYFGHVSYRKLKVVSVEKIYSVKACKCGLDLEAYGLFYKSEEVNWDVPRGGVTVISKIKTFSWDPGGTWRGLGSNATIGGKS